MNIYISIYTYIDTDMYMCLYMYIDTNISTYVSYISGPADVGSGPVWTGVRSSGCRGVRARRKAACHVRGLRKFGGLDFG